MGQRASRTSSGSRQEGTATISRAPSFLLMEFAQFWLGGDLLKLPVARLPSSWDELLDWSEDAEIISTAISSSSSHLGASKHHGVIRIVPLFISTEQQRVDSLASIQPIEQAKLFAEAVSPGDFSYFASSLSPLFTQQVISQLQVVIKFEMEGGTIDSRVPDRLLTVRDFAEYYTLVRRLSDLLALNMECSEGNGLDTTPGPTQLAECVICCTETSNSILPCNHRICESCERRWVRKRLKCPFCRTKFKSVKQIRNCAWHLSEFSQAELREDLEDLFAKLDQFWKSCGYTTATEDTLALFEPVGRRINMTQDEDDFVVSKS